MFDGFINRKDQAGGFSGGDESILFDQKRFPDESLVSVTDALGLVPDIDAEVFSTLGVFLAESIKDFHRVETGIIGEGSWDDFKGLGHRDEDELFLGFDGPGVGSEEFGEFHFAGATTGDDVFGFEDPTDDHDGVVKGSFGFFDELISAASKDHGGGFGVRASGE